MKAIKGCTNEICGYNIKTKKHFKEIENFCSMCGERLQYLCIRCHAVVSDPNVRYCEECQKEVDAHKEKVIADAKKVKELGVGVAVKIAENPELINVAIKAKDMVVEQAPKLAKNAINIIKK